MKKNAVSTIIFLVGFSMVAQSAMAVGIGFYGTWAMGKGIQTWEVLNTEKKYKTSHMKWGGGILIDSAVAKDTIFNNRLYLGFGMNTRTTDFSGTDAEVEMYDFSLFNTFGFGLVRLSFMRLWLGPQIGITYSFGDFDFVQNREYYEVGFFGGISSGINFNIGTFLSFSVDGGFRYGGLANYYDISSTSVKTLKPFATAYEGFINVSVIFRIGDEYEGAK
jgi:hypothetical protein